jgi:hypothetical protein
MKKAFQWNLIILFLLICIPSMAQKKDLLKKAVRQEKAGWIYIHIEGKPYERGYQHGYLLSNEIRDAVTTLSFYVKKQYDSSWDFFKKTAKDLYWPKVPTEYRDEIRGIYEGAKDAGYKDLELMDIVALNGWIETAWYYLPWYRETVEKKKTRTKDRPKGSCSAFIATGNATKDGRIVMAHNSWFDYMASRLWNVIMDLNPDSGNRILMQTYPGFIHSGTDWYISSAGILATETTITQFFGYNPDGIPEFVRVRKATQYANSLDEWLQIMIDQNTGGYANDWLVGDIKTGEIARLELGAKNYAIWRTFNGYFAGCNIALNDEVRREETTFDYDNPKTSPYCRYSRWQQLMKQYYGEIDVELAKAFMADHFDISRNRYQPSARTLCGHIELDPEGSPEWEVGPYYPSGAVDAKATDSALASQMKTWAFWGHSCGLDFRAEEFLKQHPEYEWQKPFLKDILAQTWTLFSIHR